MARKTNKSTPSTASFLAVMFSQLGIACSEAMRSRALDNAYHGGRETERAVNGTTGLLFIVGIVVRLLEPHGTVSCAEARDGTIVRLLDGYGKQAYRVFFSTQGKYADMFGVSGKERANMENALSNVSFDWVQQGTGNYYFSSNLDALVKYLG